MQPDPLRAERSAFLDASVAASNAVQDLARFAFDQPESGEEASALLHAVRLLADKQTDVLTALALIIHGGCRLGSGSGLGGLHLRF